VLRAATRLEFGLGDIVAQIETGKEAKFMGAELTVRQQRKERTVHAVSRLDILQPLCYEGLGKMHD